MPFSSSNHHTSSKRPSLSAGRRVHLKKLSALQWILGGLLHHAPACLNDPRPMGYPTKRDPMRVSRTPGTRGYSSLRHNQRVVKMEKQNTAKAEREIQFTDGRRPPTF